MPDGRLTRVVFENDGKSQCYTGEAASGNLRLDRDRDTAPSSIEYLLFALGSCVIGTLRNYLVNKNIETRGLRVELTSAWDETSGTYRDIRVTIDCGQEPTDKMRRIFHNVAKSCRIHKTLANKPNIEIAVADATSWSAT